MWSTGSNACVSIPTCLLPKYESHDVCVQNIDYNVPGGKLNRGMSVVDSVEILKRRKLDGEEYFKAALLGWCVEFVSLSSLLYFSAACCAGL